MEPSSRTAAIRRIGINPDEYFDPRIQTYRHPPEHKCYGCAYTLRSDVPG